MSLANENLLLQQNANQRDRIADLEAEVKRLREERNTLIRRWSAYEQFLREKYPATDCKPWRFTCEHHRAIDEILKQENRDAE